MMEGRTARLRAKQMVLPRVGTLLSPSATLPRDALSVTLPAGTKKSFAHSLAIWISSIAAFPSL